MLLRLRPQDQVVAEHRVQQALLLAEIGIGIAWASILAMPYAILASNLPQAKLGIYMGLFNIFIVVPQLPAASAHGRASWRAFWRSIGLYG